MKVHLRAHWIQTVPQFRQFAFFLIPLLRQITARNFRQAALENALLALGIWLLLYWSACRFTMIRNTHTVQLQSGLFTRTRTVLRASAGFAVLAEQFLLPHLFGAQRVRFFSRGYSHTLSLFTARENADRLFRTYESNSRTHEISPRFVHVLWTAAAQSHLLTWLPFLFPTVRGLRRLLNAAAPLFGSSFGVNISTPAQFSAVMIPLLLFGWIFASILQVRNYWPFHIVRESTSLRITCGFFPKRRFHLIIPRLRAIVLQQTLPMYGAGLYSVYTVCPHISKSIHQIVLHPAATKTQLSRWLYLPYKMQVSPPKRARRKYFRRDTILLVGGVLFLCAAPFWAPIRLFYGTVAIGCIACLWRLLLLHIAFPHIRIVLHANAVTVCTVRFFSIITARVPLHQIAAITLSRHPLQYRHRLCTLRLYAEGVRRPWVIRHLSLDEANRFCSRIAAASC